MEHTTEFISFCQKNGINPEMYNKALEIPRFIRLKPVTDMNITFHMLKQSILDVQRGDTGDENSLPPNKRYKMAESVEEIQPVGWLPKEFQFYQLSSDINISNSKYYRQGIIYGLDISSAVAVFALNPNPGEHILDMCCAPGAKLCLIADYIQIISQKNRLKHNFYLTGVDVSIDRLNTCKSLLKKYKTINTRLVLADGTKFAFNPKKVPIMSMEGRKLKRNLVKWARLQKEAIKKHSPGNHCSSLTLPDPIASNGIVFYETSGTFHTERIKNSKLKSGTVHTEDNKMEFSDKDSYSMEQFDKIILDAECTTDGSVKHIIKMVEEGWDKYHDMYFNEQRLREITELQRALLANSFRILKPGGTLVYSTCSFTREQNEHVIQWFMDNNSSTASLVHPFEDTLLDCNLVPHRAGFIQNTIRFDPISTNTSGLFIADRKSVV